MQDVKQKLAELTGVKVEYAEYGDLHRFRFERGAGKATHWLYVDRKLVSDEGSEVIIQRFEEYEPYLNEESSQRVTLTSNGVAAKPADD